MATKYGASGKASFAEGNKTLASGVASHAEGYNTIASGDYGAHAEGCATTASGENSHAEGYKTTASGKNSHVEGYKATASGYAAHAEGFESKAYGWYSHAEGYETIAQNTNMHAAGRYNVGTAKDTIHEIGIGASVTDRKNAFEIYTDGRLKAPELTTVLISDPRSLVTKEYVDVTIGDVGGGELTKVVENGKTGYRLKDADPNNYGDIGTHAIDLSYSKVASGVVGATGDYSFAGGGENWGYGTTGVISSGISSFAFGAPFKDDAGETFLEASGNHSAAFNYGTQATGSNSFAIGKLSHAEGQFCFAGGDRSYAGGYASFAFGTSSSTPAGGFDNAAFTEGKVKDGNHSFAINMGQIYGDFSFVSGGQVGAFDKNVNHAFSMGYATNCLADHTFSFGGWVNTTDEYSASFGMKIDNNHKTSFCSGLYLRTGEDSSAVFGKYNSIPTGGIFLVGIGTSVTDTKNAFEVYTDGRIVAPELTTALINDARSLVTKEYVDANAGGSDVKDINIQEYQFTATADQTAFVITDKIFTENQMDVYTNRLRDRKNEYSVSDNGTDTTVTFNTGKTSGDLVDIVVYV